MLPLESNNTETPVPAGGPGRLRKLGLALVVLSFVLYGGILLVPFLPLSTGGKIAVSSGLAVTGELSFWIGGIILGREIIARYRNKLNPLRWFKGRDDSRR